MLAQKIDHRKLIVNRTGDTYEIGPGDFVVTTDRDEFIAVLTAREARQIFGLQDEDIA